VTVCIGKALYRGGVRASTSPPKEQYAESNDNLVKLIQPGAFTDQLTDGARESLHDWRALLIQSQTQRSGKRAGAGRRAPGWSSRLAVSSS